MESSDHLSQQNHSSQKFLSNADVIRPELNLEKWPSLWEPAKSRRVFKTRVIERDITLSNGNSMTARVRIAPSTEGTLTTEEQRHFYGLIRIWEEDGRLVEEVTHFSLQRLAKVLKKGWGPRNIETMVQSLTRLLATTIFWENAYFDKANGETKKELHGFHILEELYVAQVSKNGHVTKESCYFRFNNFILNNMLANHTKPVLLDTVLAFQSDIAQILYTYLDLMLSDKDWFRRRSRELFFDELGLKGSAYQNVSDRKRTLERVLKELQGVQLTTGFITGISLEKTVDGKDYNLVVRKGRSKPKKVIAIETVSVTPPLFLESFASEEKMPLPASSESSLALSIVSYFYEIFHQSGSSALPSSKEIAQAQDHLERLGEEATRFLIQYAFQEAPKTKFSIQTYGGILRYEARAMNAFSGKRAQEETRREEKQKAVLIKAHETHSNRFQTAYLNYLRQTLAQRETETSEAFMAFLDHDLREREKFVRQKLHAYLRSHFDTEEARLKRFADFFASHADSPVLDFWEWDKLCNPEKFMSETV